MEIFVGKKLKFLSIDFLLVENILVVHLPKEPWVFDAIGLQKFQIGHLECLTNGLCYQLGLHTQHTDSQSVNRLKDSWVFKRLTIQSMSSRLKDKPLYKGNKQTETQGRGD